MKSELRMELEHRSTLDLCILFSIASDSDVVNQWDSLLARIISVPHGLVRGTIHSFRFVRNTGLSSLQWPVQPLFMYLLSRCFFIIFNLSTLLKRCKNTKLTKKQYSHHIFRIYTPHTWLRNVSGEVPEAARTKPTPHYMNFFFLFLSFVMEYSSQDPHISGRHDGLYLYCFIKIEKPQLLIRGALVLCWVALRAVGKRNHQNLAGEHECSFVSHHQRVMQYPWWTLFQAG